VKRHEERLPGSQTKAFSHSCQKTGETCDYNIRLNWEGRRGKQSDSNLVAFSRDTLSPTIPPKGFKLVHQYPSVDTPGGRRLEPLTGLSSPPKTDIQNSRSQADVNFVEVTPSLSRETEPHRNKRTKLSDPQSADSPEKRPYSSHSSIHESNSATLRFSGCSSASAASPLTPATSSTYSDDGQAQSSRVEQQEAPTFSRKRLSVNSLLAGPANLRALYNDSTSQSKGMLPPLDTRPVSSEPTFYGIDRGYQDYDLGKNDDMNAIGGSSPLLQRETLDISFEEPMDDYPWNSWNEFGFGVETNDPKDADGGYYAKPVSILIPRNLEPLPLKYVRIVFDSSSCAR